MTSQPTTQDLRPGQTITYTINGTKVTKRVLSHNINDIKRVLNMRCNGNFQIIK